MLLNHGAQAVDWVEHGNRPDLNLRDLAEAGAALLSPLLVGVRKSTSLDNSATSIFGRVTIACVKGFATLT
jgi:hypothetical protein